LDLLVASLFTKSSLSCICCYERSSACFLDGKNAGMWRLALSTVKLCIGSFEMLPATKNLQMSGSYDAIVLWMDITW
jgi:hypothetical protein